MDTKEEARQYELPTGAIATLDDILPSGMWYKDNPKPGPLITRSVEALEALPKFDPQPKPVPGMTEREHVAAVREWRKPTLILHWTERQKSAVKVCVSFYLKNGGLPADASTAALLRLCGLHTTDTE